MKSLSGEALENVLETYNRLNSQFERENGYAIQSEITGVLKGLGFAEEETSPKKYPRSPVARRPVWP